MTQTNELIAFDASKVRIPARILGKEFSNTLQFSALEKRFVFVGIGAKIPHKMAGVEITEEQRGKLMLDETLHIVGLTGKAGKKYNSYIRWNPQLEKIDFSSNAEFKKREVAPTQEYKIQAAGNNDCHKPASLNKVK